VHCEFAVHANPLAFNVVPATHLPLEHVLPVSQSVFAAHVVAQAFVTTAVVALLVALHIFVVHCVAVVHLAPVAGNTSVLTVSPLPVFKLDS
jgi:hypothetical protein